MSPKQHARRVIRINETGIPGKWDVGLRLPDGRVPEHCFGMGTEGDAGAGAKGRQSTVATTIRWFFRFITIQK
jgi:hypothetical protein